MRHRQYALDGFELSDFEAEAIAFIQKHEPPKGYFVGFSGGKDSIVTLELVRMAGVKHEAYFSNTLIEHKEIYSFIKKHYQQVKWLRPKMTIFEGVRKKNPPQGSRAGAVMFLKKTLQNKYLSNIGLWAYARKKAVTVRRVVVSQNLTSKYSTSQFFLGKNGQYGNLSKNIIFHIPTYMMRDMDAWGV